MKKFIVPVLSICFFISCSTDDTALNTVETTTDSASDGKITTKSLNNPENPANAFDYVGQLHTEILDDYLQNHQDETTLTGIIDNVDATAVSNTDFVSISDDYSGLDAGIVQWTMANINYPKNIMNKAGLSERGTLLMEDFIALIEILEFQPYNDACNSIKAFESTVMNDGYLTESDEQIILSAASIARYSIYYSGIRVRKWSRTKNGITASAFTNDVAEAVTMSVTADLLTN